MRKVLIVDDEMLARKMLKESIHCELDSAKRERWS